MCFSIASSDRLVNNNKEVVNIRINKHTTQQGAMTHFAFTLLLMSLFSSPTHIHTTHSFSINERHCGGLAFCIWYHLGRAVLRSW
jgi:hypothetical protein